MQRHRPTLVLFIVSAALVFGAIQAQAADNQAGTADKPRADTSRCPSLTDEQVQQLEGIQTRYQGRLNSIQEREFEAQVELKALQKSGNVQGSVEKARQIVTIRKERRALRGEIHQDLEQAGLPIACRDAWERESGTIDHRAHKGQASKTCDVDDTRFNAVLSKYETRFTDLRDRRFILEMELKALQQSGDQSPAISTVTQDLQHLRQERRDLKQQMLKEFKEAGL